MLSRQKQFDFLIVCYKHKCSESLDFLTTLCPCDRTSSGLLALLFQLCALEICLPFFAVKQTIKIHYQGKWHIPLVKFFKNLVSLAEWWIRCNDIPLRFLIFKKILSGFYMPIIYREAFIFESRYKQTVCFVKRTPNCFVPPSKYTELSYLLHFAEYNIHLHLCFV